jgi:hypothetical protein
VELQFVEGGTEWAMQGAREELALSIQRATKQRDAAQHRRDKAAEAGVSADVARLDAQLVHYNQRIAVLTDQVDAIDRGAAPSSHQIHASQVALSSAVGEHGSTQARVAQVNEAVSAIELNKAKVSSTRIAPDGSPFAGSDACIQCHREETKQWDRTAHASAYASLANDHREGDPDCVACHATGYGQPGGPGRPREIAGLRDVQCEACHGPSAEHVRSPGSALPTRSPDVAVCTGCHDGERDEGRFDLPTYWPKIVHKADRP